MKNYKYEPHHRYKWLGYGNGKKLVFKDRGSLRPCPEKQKNGYASLQVVEKWKQEIPI